MTQAPPQSQSQLPQVIAEWEARSRVVKRLLRYLTLLDGDPSILIRQGSIRIEELSPFHTELLAIDVDSAKTHATGGFTLSRDDITKLAKAMPRDYYDTRLIVSQGKLTIVDGYDGSTIIEAALTPLDWQEGLADKLRLNHKASYIMSTQAALTLTKPFTVLPDSHVKFTFSLHGIMLTASADDISIIVNASETAMRGIEVSSVFNATYNVRSLVRFLEVASGANIGIVEVRATPDGPLEAYVNEGWFTVRLFIAPAVD
jgi:hypothetical protein